jgi:hypothetical protein
MERDVSAPRSAARRLLVHARSAGRRSEQAFGFSAPQAGPAESASNRPGRLEAARDRSTADAQEGIWSALPRPGLTRH